MLWSRRWPLTKKPPHPWNGHPPSSQVMGFSCPWTSSVWALQRRSIVSVCAGLMSSLGGCDHRSSIPTAHRAVPSPTRCTCQFLPPTVGGHFPVWGHYENCCSEQLTHVFWWAYVFIFIGYVLSWICETAIFGQNGQILAISYGST